MDFRQVIAEQFDPQQPVRHVRPGEIVFLHGESADAIYQVVSGTIRCCTISEDGWRQIFRFARTDEFLGLVDLETWHFTAEAVDHVVLRTAPRERVERALQTDRRLQIAVRRFVAAELETRERQLATIAYMSAAERLRSFLQDFAGTRSSTGFIVLPMTRQDIGDHLGLTLETVSRAFGKLRSDGVIEMRGASRFRLAAPEVMLAA